MSLSFTHGFRKRDVVRSQVHPELRRHFDQQPDYSTPLHVDKYVETTPIGGTITREHKVTLSGQCRSIDHETAIDALACSPLSNELIFRLAPGVDRLPEDWHVGTILLGSEHWHCSHEAFPGDAGDIHFDESKHAPMVRRIVHIEETVDGHVTVQTWPVQATECVSEAFMTLRHEIPADVTPVEYMTMADEWMADLRKRQAGNDTAGEEFDPENPRSYFDYHRTFHLASVDVNYNSWAERNLASASAIAMPTDLMGVKIRCLECWMKLAIGVEVTFKGSRIEPMSDFTFDVIRIKVFGKLAMAVHMAVDIPYASRYRKELFVRASVLRMLDTRGGYWTKPHGKFPVLSYLGISLVSISLKLDLTTIIRIGMSNQFRFNTGFRVNDAALEFGIEKIGEASPQLFSAANFDGELIPLDFAFNEGSHGYAFAGFGPHLMAWPWVIGTGQVQRLLNVLAWGDSIALKKRLAFPNINVFPSVQVGSRFAYSNEEECFQAKPEMSLAVWIWHEMATIMSVSKDFYAPGRGITYGYSSNFGAENLLWSTPLAEPKCLINIDLKSLHGGDGPCDNLEPKCIERCMGRITEKRPVSTPTVCKCSYGAAVMQCSDESTPYVVHPDGGVSARITDEGVDEAYEMSGISAPKINVPELAPVCEKLLSCDECASHSQCGWCASLERCIPGDLNNRPAQCHAGDWLYETCFRNPEFSFVNVPTGSVWRSGEQHEIQWTSRQDVPVAKVAISFRLSSGSPWLLAAAVSNAGKYTFTVPDSLPATDEFQLIVQALPDDAPIGQGVVDLPVSTKASIAALGRAYATTPMITIVVPIKCQGLNGEDGRCMAPESCAAADGVLLYKGRRNERQGCEEAVGATIQCCGAAGKKRAAPGTPPSLSVTSYGACPVCGPAGIKATRQAMCFEDGQAPRLLKEGDACGSAIAPALTTSCGALPACEVRKMAFVRPSEMFAVETNVATAGKVFSVSWQGGILDVDTDLQVLVGSGCASSDSGVDVDASAWTTVATSPAFTGNNGLEWTVPADFVSTPQWTRFRLVARSSSTVLTAISSPVLIAPPLEASVLVNGMPAPAVAAPFAGSRGSTNVNGEDKEQMADAAQGLAGSTSDMQSAAPSPADPTSFWGSVTLHGSVANVLLDFTGASNKRAVFDIGHLVAVELTVSNEAVQQALTSVEVVLGGLTYTVKAPLATATYACDMATKTCSLDQSDAVLATTSDSFPEEQRCLFDESFTNLAVTNNLGDVGGDDEESGLSVGAIVGISIAAVACVGASVTGLFCMLKRKHITEA